MSRKDLNDILRYERNAYKAYMFPSRSRWILSWIKKEPTRQIWHCQYLMRKTQYYYSLKQGNRNPLVHLLYLWYISRYNRVSSRLGMDFGITPLENVGKGLMIYHSHGVVVNGNSVIGENCRFHGNNCIGRPDDIGCPVIGNTVMLGVGATVLGPVEIADDVKIMAGAVVVSSFTEKGITIGGIPAKKVK